MFPTPASVLLLLVFAQHANAEDTSEDELFLEALNAQLSRCLEGLPPTTLGKTFDPSLVNTPAPSLSGWTVIYFNEQPEEICREEAMDALRDDDGKDAAIAALLTCLVDHYKFAFERDGTSPPSAEAVKIRRSLDCAVALLNAVH